VRLTPFVGRQPELSALSRELERANRGGRLALVVGEAGVGKSRLLLEFSTRERRRARFLTGRGSPISTSIPFSVLIEALESMLRTLPANRLVELGGVRLPDLAQLLPSASLSTGRVKTDPSRLQLLEALRSLLEALAREQPLVLLLDDLHQCDRSTWEALNYLGRNPPQGRVMVAAAVRSDELFDIPELAALIATLVKDGLASEIRLGPLDAESVATLARRTLPATVTDESAGWLFARARGNALYTVELLADLAVDPNRRVVPIGVQERVRMTLMELTQESREVLELGAVFGGWFALDSILALIPGVAAAHLDELVRRGLIAEIARRAGPGYEFAHPLIQESIYAGLGAARRRELHHELSTRLTNAPLAVRAYHAALGAAPGDLRTIALLRSAAVECEADEAHRDALVHLERAIELLPPGRTAMRRELLDEIAWQASAAGEYRAGIRALEALAPLVAGDDAESARTDVRLASFLATGVGDLARAEVHASRAVARLTGGSDQRTLAAALNELAWIKGEGGDLGAQVAQARRAADLARQSRADDVLLHSLGCLGHALALIGDFPTALATLGESVGLAKAAGDGGQLGWHSGSMAVALLLAGRGGEAIELMDALLGARPNTSDVAYFSRALVNWDLGRWDAVLADVRTVQALNPSAPSVHSSWVLSLGGAVLAGHGKADEARSFLAQAERIYRDRPFYCFSAWHDWAAGHTEWLLGYPIGARARFERAVRRLDAMGARAAADHLRPDLWQVIRELGEAAPEVSNGPPIRQARTLAQRGDLGQAIRIYAALPAPQEERRLLALLRSAGAAGRREARRSGTLTEREKAVAALAAKGLSDRQIADRLHIGDRTVETHLAHVYAKLGINGRGDLRREASV
jgi:DNA-binding CsgD family transcriptional regulator